MLSDLPKQLHQNATICANTHKNCFEYSYYYSQELEILAEIWKEEGSSGAIFLRKINMEKAKQFQNTTRAQLAWNLSGKKQEIQMLSKIMYSSTLIHLIATSFAERINQQYQKGFCQVFCSVLSVSLRWFSLSSEVSWWNAWVPFHRQGDMDMKK